MAKRQRIPKFKYPKPPIPKAVLTNTIKGLGSIKSQSVRITDEIVKAVTDAAAAGKRPANALSIGRWRKLLLEHVSNHVGKKGDWATDGPNVLSVASGMGTIAAILSASLVESGENQLKAAFAACKANPTCSRGGVGGGDWCTFSWI